MTNPPLRGHPQYTAAVKSSTLDSVARSLTSLHQVLKSDLKLSPILHAPTLTAADKSAIVSELEKHTGPGGDKGGTMKNFLQTLAENNRLGLLEGVCEKFGELMGAYRGEMELVITSAQRLEERMVRRVEAAVAKSEYSQGKKIKVVTKVCYVYLVYLRWLAGWLFVRVKEGLRPQPAPVSSILVM
jgi:F-type H+-transporting ATPase subunit O